ncbi:MAG: hypothetical protein K5911_02280, partial [Eubacteriales bacterium]|nr:hypothetical protein [Eubacteriales bacterium]
MSKKITAVVLAALLIFTSVGAVFAWTSFQNDNALNNGVINDGHTYVTSSVSPVSYTTLSRGGWAGIDCPPLV